MCCKKHLCPKASSTLLFRNMLRDPLTSCYRTGCPFKGLKFFSLEKEEMRSNKIKSNYRQYMKFIKDVYPEFEKFGTVKKVLVSNNIMPHLRGNVYVFFSNILEAIECYKKMVGRYYGGYPLLVEYSYIVSANEAICQYRKKCPRFDECNFLHLYQTPKPVHRSRSPREKFI